MLERVYSHCQPVIKPSITDVHAPSPLGVCGSATLDATLFHSKNFGGFLLRKVEARVEKNPVGDDALLSTEVRKSKLTCQLPTPIGVSFLGLSPSFGCGLRKKRSPIVVFHFNLE